MAPETVNPKSIETMGHLWPYISGTIVAVAAGIRMWLKKRKELHTRIKNVEKIAEHAVTHQLMQECKEEALSADKEIELRILEEVKKLREEGVQLRKDIRADNKAHAAIHHDIMTTMVRLHKHDDN